MMNLKTYYGPQGAYLKEHQSYFTQTHLREEVDFLVDVLKIKKTDTVLDLACGHGRHAIELKKRGFNVEGLDFSAHLLSLAKRQAVRERLDITFYKKNINTFRLQKRYDKIFLIFSEFGLFDAQKVLNNIHRSLKENGLFMLDCDSLFRLIGYLQLHPKTPYYFDCVRMELKEKGKTKSGVRYYTSPEIALLLEHSNFRIVSTFGGYRKEPFSVKSKRMIVVAEIVKK